MDIEFLQDRLQNLELSFGFFFFVLLLKGKNIDVWKYMVITGT
jgi:hypothetical protein